VLQLKSAWRDGTTHIVMSPQEFMHRLAARVARPRLHLIRFHGVLAPNAKLRAAVVPGTVENPNEPSTEHAHAPSRKVKLLGEFGVATGGGIWVATGDLLERGVQTG